MKAILFLAALMPLGVLAQPININNNPNQPGYVDVYKRQGQSRPFRANR